MNTKKVRRPEARPILSAPYGKFWNNINKNTSEFGSSVLPQSTQVSTSFQEETGRVCSITSRTSSENSCEPVCTNSESNTSNPALFKSTSDQEESLVKEEKTSTKKEKCQTAGTDNNIIPMPSIELTQIPKINHTIDSNLELKIILTRLPESVHGGKSNKDIKSSTKQSKTSRKKRVFLKMEPEIVNRGGYDSSGNDICLKDSYSQNGSKNTGNITKSISLCSSEGIHISEEQNEQTVSEMSSTSRSNGCVMMNGGCSKNRSSKHKNTSDSRQQTHPKKTGNTSTRKRKSVSGIENTKKRNKLVIKFTTPTRERNSSDSSRLRPRETTTSASKKRLKRCVNNEIETCLKTQYEKQFGPLTRCEVRLKKLTKGYLERAISGAGKYKNIQKCDVEETEIILGKRLKDKECGRCNSVSNCADFLEYNDDWGNDTIDSWGNVRYISKDHSNYNELEEDWCGWLVRIDSLQDTCNADLYSLSDGVTESRIVVWDDHPYSNFCEENYVRPSDIGLVHLSGKTEIACEESQDSDEDWPGWNVLYVDINIIDQSSSVSQHKKAASGFHGW